MTYTRIVRDGRPTWRDENGNLRGAIPILVPGGQQEYLKPEPLTPDDLVAEGRGLYEAVGANLRRHFFLKEQWQYSLVSLFVLQCKVALALPGVFYLGVGGAKGSGKTRLLAHVMMLVHGHLFGNVSIPALARRMKHGDAVAFDELDESKGREYDVVRDALLRDGYRPDAPKYERWDYKARASEEISVYGPKMFGFRSSLEDALQDRTLPIPSVKPKDEGDAREKTKFVRQNLFPRDDGLPDRLDVWGRATVDALPIERLERLTTDERFLEKLQRAVEDLGTNRETEKSIISLLVAEMAGIDVTEDLRAANEAAKSVGDPEPLEQLRIAIRSLVRLAREKGDVGLDGSVRLRQRDVLENVNGYRAQGRQRPLSDRSLAKWRRELGVDDNMIRRPQNKVTWIVPKSLVDTLLESGDSEDEKANRLTGGEA